MFGRHCCSPQHGAALTKSMQSVVDAVIDCTHPKYRSRRGEVNPTSVDRYVLLCSLLRLVNKVVYKDLAQELTVEIWLWRRI